MAADVGCLAGGWVSGAFVKRGWSVNRARKATMAMLAAIMSPMVIAAGFTTDVSVAIALIAVACGCHQAWSTLVFTIASDLFPTHAVGSVAGIGGFVAGMASIVAAELIGRLLQQDAGYYLPVFVAAGLLYPAGLAGLSRAQPEDGAGEAAILKTMPPFAAHGVGTTADAMRTCLPTRSAVKSAANCSSATAMSACRNRPASSIGPNTSGDNAWPASSPE